MTTLHACGFLVLGWVLGLLPVLAPEYFPPDSLDGANTSALWLEFMGWVNGGLGAGYVTRLQVQPLVVRALTWRPTLPPEMQPAELLRPAMDFYGELEAAADERERGAA
jgi:hypothetical protein